MNDTDLIRSHLRSLEAQLRVLEARIRCLSPDPAPQQRPFGDLYGRLRGMADSSEEEIEAVLYKCPDMTQDEY